MDKKIISEIKTELLNKEMTFTELDNYMMESGYYSVFDDGITENIKLDKNVVYTAKGNCLYEIIIFFDIITDSGEDDFCLKVTELEKF